MKFWASTAFMKTAEMPAVAQMVEEAGFHGVLVSDHLTFPREMKTRYDGHESGQMYWPADTEWPDAWALISAMAAVTTTLQFGSYVYIAPARPLIEVVKQVGTASAIAGGRVSLGLSAGWMREEFELTGQDFDNRGPRLTEMIGALRELWQGGWVSWNGEYYEVPEMMIEPHPPGRIPILCGGESGPALRRAAQHGDGWVGTAYTLDDAGERIDRINRLRREYGREDEPFEFIMALYDPPTVETFERAESAGVTGIVAPLASWVEGRPDDPGVGAGAERFRAPITEFRENIIDRLTLVRQ
ncbi:TIGR03619 family F420-dependent LLM class oxidoreductase [Dietzia sp. CH92]|uniref:TIGR03619 family F420-dependent LLM class oxidoreductase n=1 Tax=Dietzia sp. CH92 TaxID=3051823 RepID=UPI0028D8657A|nr:TIGR03619 family F420-dependent LLM class oxidoreductase [Dietzia sp. CH92]